MPSALKTKTLNRSQHTECYRLQSPGQSEGLSELKLANGIPLVWIPKENGHHLVLKWTEDEQAKLKTLVERYTSWGASGAWGVYRWWLVCTSLLLDSSKDVNDFSG